MPPQSQDDAAKDDAAPDTSGGCAPPLVEKVVLSNQFSVLVGLVIFLNVVMMMCQVNDDDKGHNEYWMHLNAAFLGFFFIEISLKMIVYGIKGFFCDPKEGIWNGFDFFIVFTGVCDYAVRLVSVMMGLHMGGNSQFSLIIRTLRILRVLRVVKLLRQFKKLRLLARGLTESVSYIFWVAILIIAFIFLCSIVTTQIIGQNADLWGEDADKIRMYFGSCAKSMFTLFQFMTLDDWNYVFVLVSKEMPDMQPFFIFYVVMSAFILLSLLTGSMVEHMDQVQKQEDEDDGNVLNQTDPNLIENMFRKNFFGDADEDQNEELKIEKEDFGRIFVDKNIARDVGADDIQLTGEEAMELFPLFDKDGDGCLSAAEFKQGLAEYRAGLTMKQVLSLKRAMLYMTREVEKRHAVPDQWRGGAKKATGQAEKDIIESEAQVRGLELRLQSFDTKIASLKKLVQAQFGADGDESVDLSEELSGDD